ncbi:hypothetical protein HDU67_007348 [Dinochytrium kinnereticum]|nr:hypothetical protein HDU67_007348 [Dinochytrium kinnereticum]
MPRSAPSESPVAGSSQAAQVPTLSPAPAGEGEAAGRTSTQPTPVRIGGSGRRRTPEEEEAARIAELKQQRFANLTLPSGFFMLNAVLIVLIVATVAASSNSQTLSGRTGGSEPEDAATRLYQFLLADAICRLVMAGHCVHTILTYLSARSERIARLFNKLKPNFSQSMRERQQRRMDRDGRGNATMLVVMDADSRSHITNVILMRVYAAWCVGGQFLYFFSLNGVKASVTLFAVATACVVVWELTAIFVIVRTLTIFGKRVIEDHRRVAAIRALRNRYANTSRSGPATANPRVIELGPARSYFRNPADGAADKEGGELSAYTVGFQWNKGVGGQPGALSIPDTMSVDHLDTDVLMKFAGLPVFEFKKVERCGKDETASAGKEKRVVENMEKEVPQTVVAVEDSVKDLADGTTPLTSVNGPAAPGTAPESAKDTCAICMCDFEDGDKVRRLKCDHDYHMSCIDPWVLSRPLTSASLSPGRPSLSNPVPSSSSSSSSSSSATILNDYSTHLSSGIRRCPLCGRDPITAQVATTSALLTAGVAAAVSEAALAQRVAARPRTDRLARRDPRREREEAMAVAAAASLAASRTVRQDEEEFVSVSML